MQSFVRPFLGKVKCKIEDSVWGIIWQGVEIARASSAVLSEGVSKFDVSDSGVVNYAEKMKCLDCGGRNWIFRVVNCGMKPLAITGSAALLEELSSFVPDDFINSLFVAKSRRGRPREFSPAQLYRVSLLGLLTPAHTFNLLVELLAEHKLWRSFARLRNRWAIPDPKMLHGFREQIGVGGLRRINELLLEPLLEGLARFPQSVALMDATDLPAATSAYKKRSLENTRPAVPA